MNWQQSNILYQWYISLTDSNFTFFDWNFHALHVSYWTFWCVTRDNLNFFASQCQHFLVLLKRSTEWRYMVSLLQHQSGSKIIENDYSVANCCSCGEWFRSRPGNRCRIEDFLVFIHSQPLQRSLHGRPALGARWSIFGNGRFLAPQSFAIWDIGCSLETAALCRGPSEHLALRAVWHWADDGKECAGLPLLVRALHVLL